MSEYRILTKQAEIDHIVLGLRELRKEWRKVTQPQGVTYELPSQDSLGQILDDLAAILFPRHFGPPSLTEETVDAFIYRTLDTIFAQLAEQIRRELRLVDPAPTDKIEVEDPARTAQDMTKAFCANIPKIRMLLETDVQAAFRGDPAARSRDEVLICYPGIKAVMRHRLAHELYLLGAPLIARLISESAHSVTGIDIHPGASIGKSFFIDHGTGVVIGETAVIGENVRVYQAVTLGAKRFTADETGALVKGMPRHPLIEDDVVIYAGATILGRVTIGKGSVIGGNVWLTHSVPPNSNISQTQPRNDVFIGGGGI